MSLSGKAGSERCDGAATCGVAAIGPAAMTDRSHSLTFYGLRTWSQRELDRTIMKGFGHTTLLTEKPTGWLIPRKTQDFRDDADVASFICTVTPLPPHQSESS
jgi:hypothetical protein